jgi:predicted HicB family RNase H-like nuclease
MRKTKQIVTRVSAELHREVKIKAAKLDVTVSQVIRQALREWVSGEVSDEEVRISRPAD